ncbi:hypothetical protein M427DRAFT_64944 [Gonapodya prolifera JEL478]|uniref:EamA domain-containing protein n=1 Tax=Gonapodya prolifera (strain JEL478) TaxID=1344416 RepID=A0A138ZWY3_GONPJ|nr:hypothetical protein M427DRAFT_64944 [Gonapodya prolifera JEL478]|eukprot:KXS08998.1 hypothetical protein M427DRAFT_64944 [Gonapodya prolifera JEL478]
MSDLRVGVLLSLATSACSALGLNLQAWGSTREQTPLAKRRWKVLRASLKASRAQNRIGAGHANDRRQRRKLVAETNGDRVGSVSRGRASGRVEDATTLGQVDAATQQHNRQPQSPQLSLAESPPLPPTYIPPLATPHPLGLALNTAHVHLSDSEDINSPDSPLTMKHASIGVGNGFGTNCWDHRKTSVSSPTSGLDESFGLPAAMAPVNTGFMGGIFKAVSAWAMTSEAAVPAQDDSWEHPPQKEAEKKGDANLPNYLTASQMSIRIASPPSEFAEVEFSVPPSPDTSIDSLNLHAEPSHRTSPAITSHERPYSSPHQGTPTPPTPGLRAGTAHAVSSDCSTVTPNDEVDHSEERDSRGSQLSELSGSSDGDDGADTYSADRSDSDNDTNGQDEIEYDAGGTERALPDVANNKIGDYFSRKTFMEDANETTPLLASSPSTPILRSPNRRTRQTLAVSTPKSPTNHSKDLEITVATPLPTSPLSSSDVLSPSLTKQSQRLGHHRRRGAKKSKSNSSTLEKPFPWQFYAGFLLYVSSQSILTAITLPYLGPLLMAPLSSLSLIFNVVFAWLINGGKVGWRDVAGTIAVVAGSVVCGVGGVDTGQGSPANVLPKLYTSPLFLIYALFLFLVSLSLYLLANFLYFTRIQLRTYPWLRFMRRVTGFRKDPFAEDSWRVWLNDVAGEGGAGDWLGKVEGVERGVGVGFAVAGGLAASGTLVLGRHTMDLISSTFLPHSMGPPSSTHPILLSVVVIFLLLTVLIQLTALGHALPLATPLVAVPVFFAAYVLPGLPTQTIISLSLTGRPGISSSQAFDLIMGMALVLAGVAVLATSSPDKSTSQGDSLSARDVKGKDTAKPKDFRRRSVGEPMYVHVGDGSKWPQRKGLERADGSATSVHVVQNGKI